MELSDLEKDLLGDLGLDTHGSWEVFDFVRLHYPQATDIEVLRRGRDVIEAWIRRGWIALSTTPLHPSHVRTLYQLISEIDVRGVEAIHYYEGAPSIELTEKARAEVDWLGPG